MNRKLKTLLACFSLSLLCSCEIPNIVFGGQHYESSVSESSVSSEAASAFKKPSKAYSTWQEYTTEKYVTESVKDKTIVYQWHKENADLSGRLYDVLINMFDDGYATIRQYYTADQYVITYYGYWTDMDDCLYLGISCHTNSMYANSAYGITYSYNLTMTDGVFDTWSVNLALGFGEGGLYVRGTDIVGDGSVAYATYADYETFINCSIEDPDYTPMDMPGGDDAKDDKDDDQENPEPEKEDTNENLLFSFTSDSENYLLDINKDCTYTFTFVTVGLVETGNWSWVDSVFSLTDSNGTVTTATVDETTKALSLHFVAACNSMLNRDFTCAYEVYNAAFNGQTTYNKPASVAFSFTSDSENYLLDINDDMTYTFTFVTVGLVEEGTWSYVDFVFSLTDTNNTVTEATRDETTNTLSLHFVAACNSMLNRDFTCTSDVYEPFLGTTGTYTAA